MHQDEQEESSDLILLLSQGERGVVQHPRGQVDGKRHMICFQKDSSQQLAALSRPAAQQAVGFEVGM